MIEEDFSIMAALKHWPMLRGKMVLNFNLTYYIKLMIREESLDKKEMKDVELLDRVVAINRTAKVVKGGRRFRFSAIVVVGDGKGMIGAGLGKAHEVPEAIRKGMDMAKKNMVKVAIVNKTIPYEVIGTLRRG